MKEYAIEVDIYGAWQDQPPSYRLYINDEMITERSFLAMEYEFVKEQFLVNLSEGTYTFRLEEQKTNSPNKLSFKNLQLNGRQVRPTFTVSN